MDSDKAKLFVGGISRDTSEDVLKIHFSRYGAISGSLVAKDKITGCPRGFGFVSFSDPYCADKALQDTHVIQGRTVEVKKAIPRNEQQHHILQHHQHQNSQQRSRRNEEYFRTKKIFVGGLSATLTLDQFRNYFERFGRISDVVVMQDSSTNRPRGFGFVTFDSEESVDRVLLKTHHDLNGRSVEVKRAVPKDGNNGSSNSYVGGGSVSVRGSNSSSQPESYPFYGTGYEFLSGYSPVPVYDGYGGYVYGTGAFSGGYPMVQYCRPSFGVIPIAPRSPWTGPMIGTEAFPFQYSDSSLYASYMNDGIGLASLAVNGYHGIGLNHLLGVNGHLPPVSMPPLVNGGKSQTKSPDSKARNGVATI